MSKTFANGLTTEQRDQIKDAAQKQADTEIATMYADTRSKAAREHHFRIFAQKYRELAFT